MIKTITVKLEGKEYKLKASSYRAMFFYEELTDKSVGDIKTLQEQMTYLYCILKVSNEHFSYNLEEFFDLLEADKAGNLLSDFAKLATEKK